MSVSFHDLVLHTLDSFSSSFSLRIDFMVLSVSHETDASRKMIATRRCMSDIFSGSAHRCADAERARRQLPARKEG